MTKFEDFDLDLRENKKENNPTTKGVFSETVKLSLQYCTLSVEYCTKLACGDGKTTVCNITKISKCTGR